jgi:hypothetical protein
VWSASVGLRCVVNAWIFGRYGAPVRVHASVLLVAECALLGATGCRCDADSPAVSAQSLGRISTSCTATVDCGAGLTCAAGTNFAHVDAGFTCELECEPSKDGVCPDGWVCVTVIDGRGSSLPALCRRDD